MEKVGYADPEIIQSRQKKLEQSLLKSGLDALALNPGPSLTYLTGLHFHLMERPFLLIFVPGAAPCLVLPELELRKIDDLPFKIRAFPYGENPLEWTGAFAAAAQAAGLSGKPHGARIGVEPTQMRLLRSVS
jgi:Xaa-Pro dipeptidase